MKTNKLIRVRFPMRYWTPMRREVFEEVLPKLQFGRTALIYLILYDRRWRDSNREVRGDFADVSRWTGMDSRTIEKCLAELISNGFITQVRSGQQRSRTNKPTWKVPLADFDFKKQGPWTPIPGFIVERYCRVYPGAVLLPVLMWHQHIGWQDWCWPGVPRLATL
jgi:hypothetical protein